tara:strand:- start:2923 stop:3948 length:1026 start_codon:yes stop_codon:yes gene_type:complete
MANVLIASNSSQIAGKWFPYYYDQFHLGRLADGDGSTDGNTYITQTTGSSAQALYGSCTHSVNCDFYYELTFVNEATSNNEDGFIVTKKNLAGTTIDTIHASAHSGDGRYWIVKTSEGSAVSNTPITIDIGVNIYIPDELGFDEGDVYKITLPSYDTMERRKIYHGGFFGFMRLPYQENISFHSETIPTNLNMRSITAVVNPPTGIASSTKALQQATSAEDIAGNEALTVALEWSVNPTADHSAAASATTFEPQAAEGWKFGTVFTYDGDTFTYNSEDFPSKLTSPFSDTGGSGDGSTDLNSALIAQRMGYAKIRFEFMSGPGQTVISAYNQFWPTFIMLH